jgi:predicted DNA-binding WGR domain protein
MSSARYFFDDGKSRKFWAYDLRGGRLTLCQGRIGSRGRETTKTFSSTSAAEAKTVKLAAQKIKKGYIKTEPATLRITRPKGKRTATEAQVAKLERRLNTTLPAEYRSFLLTQNGGVPEPFFVRIPGHPYIDNVAVGYILGLYAKSKPHESLLYAVEHKLPCLPRGHLPIAGDGDIFSISLTRNPGCIYFWNHEAPDCDDEDAEGRVIYKMSHAILLAGSFNEFLTRISAFTDDDEDAG